MAYYESTRQYINDPNKSEWFVPAIDYTKMDCTVIEQYHKKLTEQLAMWQGKYDSGNSKERTNLAEVIKVQKAKLDGYAAGLQQCMAPPATTGFPSSGGAGSTDNPGSAIDTGGMAGGTGGTSTTTTNTNVTNNSNTTTATGKPYLKYILIGAAVLAAAGLVVYAFKKKS